MNRTEPNRTETNLTEIKGNTQFPIAKPAEAEFANYKSFALAVLGYAVFAEGITCVACCTGGGSCAGSTGICGVRHHECSCGSNVGAGAGVPRESRSGADVAVAGSQGVGGSGCSGGVFGPSNLRGSPDVQEEKRASGVSGDRGDSFALGVMENKKRTYAQVARDSVHLKQSSFVPKVDARLGLRSPVGGKKRRRRHSRRGSRGRGRFVVGREVVESLELENNGKGFVSEGLGVVDVEGTPVVGVVDEIKGSVDEEVVCIDDSGVSFMQDIVGGCVLNGANGQYDAAESAISTVDMMLSLGFPSLGGDEIVAVMNRLLRTGSVSPAAMASFFSCGDLPDDVLQEECVGDGTMFEMD